MRFRPRVRRVADYCAKWGVKVEPWRSEDDVTDSGPDCVSINRYSRTLFLQSVDVGAQVGFLLHDLSYLICGEPIENDNECEGPMLALDYAHHQYLNLMRGHPVLMAKFAVGNYSKRQTL